VEATHKLFWGDQEERAALDRSVFTLREATRRAIDIAGRHPTPGPC
jgi:hypothetical protein